MIVTKEIEAIRRGIYKEDDWIVAVEILEDSSNNDKYDYILKVVKTIRESKIYKPTPDGEVFKAYQLKNAGCYSGMWSLELEEL